MCDGNLITIGGAYIDTECKTDKVMIYNTSTDTMVIRSNITIHCM